MSIFSRLKNRLVAKVATRFPIIGERLSESYSPWESEGIPWSPPNKPLSRCKVAVVTTAGVHHGGQEPFDMHDPMGDPSFRILGFSGLPEELEEPDLMITHDYYDHTDADKDLNVVFPVQRLAEMACEEVIGSVSSRHYGFMGHIDGYHLRTLVEDSAPEVASLLAEDGVDVILLTPG